jgi:hypothetical protein
VMSSMAACCQRGVGMRKRVLCMVATISVCY